MTPIWVVCAFNLETGTAAEPIVEQCCAQCCCVHAVALAVKITVPTSSTYKHHKVREIKKNYHSVFPSFDEFVRKNMEEFLHNLKFYAKTR